MVQVVEVLSSLESLNGMAEHELKVLVESLGQLAFTVLRTMEDYMAPSGGLLDEDMKLKCRSVVEQLILLRMAATRQSAEEVVAEVIWGDSWRNRLSEMQERKVFPSWIAALEGVPEPETEDCLPDWTDYYANESDYFLSEHPEFISPDY